METGKTHSYLVNALRNLPRDNALSEVRHHLLQAMNKLEHVNKKRARRANQQPHTNQWEHIPNYGLVDPRQAKQVIENLDQMIAMEKARLENIITNRNQEEKEEKQKSDYDMLVDWTKNQNK
tara:strand:- start:1752 stop:2117 length:366 start_codon:yes stop_codon:yes gene_type:complete